MASTLSVETAARLRHLSQPNETLCDVVDRLLDDNTHSTSFEALIDELVRRGDGVSAITLNKSLRIQSGTVHITVYGRVTLESWIVSLNDRYDEVQMDEIQRPLELEFAPGEPEYRFAIPLYDRSHEEFTIESDTGCTFVEEYCRRDWDQPVPLDDLAEFGEKLGWMDLSLPQTQPSMEPLELTVYGHPGLVRSLSQEVTEITIPAETESADDQSASAQSNICAVRWVVSDGYTGDDALHVVQIHPERPVKECTYPAEGLKQVRKQYCE